MEASNRVYESIGTSHVGRVQGLWRRVFDAPHGWGCMDYSAYNCRLELRVIIRIVVHDIRVETQIMTLLLYGRNFLRQLFVVFCLGCCELQPMEPFEQLLMFSR